MKNWKLLSIDVQPVLSDIVGWYIVGYIFGAVCTQFILAISQAILSKRLSVEEIEKLMQIRWSFFMFDGGVNLLFTLELEPVSKRYTKLCTCIHVYSLVL